MTWEAIRSVLLIVHILIAIGLVGIILLQRTSGDGMGGMGASGGGNFLSEKATLNAISKITMWLIAIFMINCLTLAVISSHIARNSNSRMRQYIDDKHKTEGIALPPAE